MPESVRTDADHWTACIGGAEEVDEYADVIETSGFGIVDPRENPQYEFVSDRAANARQKYGVESVSLVAREHT